jgi:sugar transferase (PEP-CTERM/EpsH1 system associated)
MRLLYFAAHQAWPLTSGNRLRDYHLARELAKRVSVTFVEMCRPSEGPSSPPSDCGFDEIISLKKGIAYTPGKIVRGLAGPAPLTALNYFQTRSACQLADLLTRRRFDTVQIEGVHLSNYLPVIRATPNRPAILIDWHNIESELMAQYFEKASFWPKRILANRTATLLRRTERMLLERFEMHTVASEHERQKLLGRHRSARVNVIPNGVDIHFYSAAQIAESRRNNQAPEPKQSILFVGSMDYHANIEGVTWFTREVWPEIAEMHPELQFIIVGRHPSREVRELASDRIRVTGTVEDVRPLYASAAAVVVPLRVGSGTRLKILEAMAAGVPVVSTRLGAEGIDAIHDVHLLLADDRAEMVAAINQIVSSPPIRSRLVLAARELVVDRYDWALIGEGLYRIHCELAQIPYECRESHGST